MKSHAANRARTRTAADKAFAERAPVELTRALGKSGALVQVFGDGDAGAETFTAWNYARFVETLVKAGKARYPLPCT